jgi:hypothetical protein
MPFLKNYPPIIRATCTFDAKIYKNVDACFELSSYAGGNKKFLKISILGRELYAVLIENLQFCRQNLVNYCNAMRGKSAS